MLGHETKMLDFLSETRPRPRPPLNFSRPGRDWDYIAVDMGVYTEELEELVSDDMLTQAPAVSQLLSCLQPLPVEDPFSTHCVNASR